MALYIVIQTGSGHRFEYEAHVGSQLMGDISEVVEVTACGTELDHIMSNFEGLPARYRGKSRQIRYFGESAKFIVANWN